jgi:hypothetical protein
VAVQVELSVIPIYEGMPSWIDTLTYLHRLGFEPIGFHPVTFHTDARIVEFDCLMVRSSQADLLGSLIPPASS